MDPRGDRDGTGDSHLREMLGVLGLERLLEADEAAPPEVQELAARRERGAGATGTGSRPTACATSCATWAGRCATARKDRSSSRRPDDRRPPARGVSSVAPGHTVVYGRNPVREALRGRRRVHQIWATERSPTTAGASAAVTVTDAGRIEALCGSDAHQGVCAEVDPYPYAGAAELLAAPDPVIVALDEVTDPQNLGAIARTAEAVGATGVVIPERRSAEVTAAVCKASAGAVEHLLDRPRAQPRRLPRRRQGGGVLVLRRGGRREHRRTRPPDWSGGVVLVLGAEGRGLRPRVAAACDDLVALPLRGRVGSLNVSATAAVLLYAILQSRLDTST